MIHRSPNQTLGRTPWFFSSCGRVSVACSKIGMRVSCHNARPSRNGEFPASATCTPARHCAAFQCAAKSFGATWMWHCTEVQDASGRIDSEKQRSFSLGRPGMGTPSTSNTISSPREAKICRLSIVYLGPTDSQCGSKCSRRNVGSIPIITSAAPASLALALAEFSESRRSRSSSSASSPANGRGGTLISMLCWPSSVWKHGSEIFSSTTVFAIAGRNTSSTRFSSISSPICCLGKWNASFASIRANASRQRCTFSR
nr:hypothetical protein GCM10020241_30570 [Streptoalloteichus tenebrarius]